MQLEITKTLETMFFKMWALYHLAKKSPDFLVKSAGPCSHTLIGNVNRCGHYGKQYGACLRN